MVRLSDIMNRRVQTVSLDVLAEEAYEMMQRGRIHHLVVMQGKDLVGVLSDRDLGGSHGDPVRQGRTVGDLMTPDVVFATPATTLREAANLLRSRAIGCLPVMERGKLVGIITVTDLLEMVGRGVQRVVPETEARPVSRRHPGQKPANPGSLRSLF